MVALQAINELLCANVAVPSKSCPSLTLQLKLNSKKHLKLRLKVFKLKVLARP